MSTVSDGLKNYLNVPRRTLSWTVELEDTLEKIGLWDFLLLPIKTDKIYRTSSFDYLYFNDLEQF